MMTPMTTTTKRTGPSAPIGPRRPLTVGSPISATVHLPDGRRLAVTARAQAPANGAREKTRVYVWGPGPKEPSPPYSVIGDDPENDKAWKKYNREEVKLMRAIMAAVVVPDRFTFSRRAGCSCGCSPGFTGPSQRSFGVDIFVHARPF